MLKFIINLILKPYNLIIKFYHEDILCEDLVQDRNGEWHYR